MREELITMSTIKEIAQRAGVSAAAVSRILNYDPTLKVAEQTRQRVFDEAKKLGYVKRKIKTKNNYNPIRIGIVQWYSIEKELNDPFYLSIRIGAESYLNQNNIEMIRSFRGDTDFLSKLSMLDGLICIGKFSNQEISEFRKLTDKVIFVDLYMPKIFVNTIVMDFRTAVLEGLEYLSGLGHTRIGFLGGIEHTSDGYFEQRFHCYQEFCRHKNWDNSRYVRRDQFTVESGYAMMLDLIAAHTVPTALFCASDAIAMGALRALHENNYLVPEDISILGFNNNQNTAYTNPPLTTIYAPARQMGELAAQFITQFAKKEKIYPMQITLPCSLILRQSCTRPRSKTK